MEKYFDILKKNPLFDGIEETGLKALLKCLAAAEKHYKKNSFIFTDGDNVTVIGIVLNGGVHVIKEDFWGGRTILANIEMGGLFGEAFSCAGIKKLPVSVLAVQPSDVLLFDYSRIIKTCSSACLFHMDVIKNMLRILAEKNVMLTRKMEFLTQRTTRGKLLSYLSEQARRVGSNFFEIPFNRQELAEYLAVDRSAMSNELSKMRDDGIINYHRNSFELLKM